MLVEGRDLSSRRRQYVVRDLEIGQPINSEECSEIADGVTRESQWQPVGQTFLVKGQNLLGLLVGRPLTQLPTELHTARPGRC